MEWKRPTQDQVGSFFSNVGKKLGPNLKQSLKNAFKKGSVYSTPSGLNYAKEMNPNIGEELARVNADFVKGASQIIRPYTLKAREKVLSLFDENKSSQPNPPPFTYGLLPPIQKPQSHPNYKLYNWITPPTSPIEATDDNEEEEGNYGFLSLMKKSKQEEQSVELAGGKRKKMKSRKRRAKRIRRRTTKKK
jgi:hypothetical protein